jgi:hypothetical protein
MKRSHVGLESNLYNSRFDQRLSTLEIFLARLHCQVEFLSEASSEPVRLGYYSEGRAYFRAWLLLKCTRWESMRRIELSDMDLTGLWFGCE